MDKFLMDPPENSNIEESEEQPEEQEQQEVIQDSTPELPEPLQQLTKESTAVQSEETENIETGPPSLPEPLQQITKESTTVQPEETENIETGPPPEVITEELESEKDTVMTFTEIPITEPVKQTWFSFLWWGCILFVFILLSMYYAFKMYANKQNYIIKINADTFQLTLDNMREDIQDWLLSWRDWKEDMSDYISQFLFRQHVQNGTFKVKK